MLLLKEIKNQPKFDKLQVVKQKQKCLLIWRNKNFWRNKDLLSQVFSVKNWMISKVVFSVLQIHPNNCRKTPWINRLTIKLINPDNQAKIYFLLTALFANLRITLFNLKTVGNSQNWTRFKLLNRLHVNLWNFYTLTVFKTIWMSY